MRVTNSTIRRIKVKAEAKEGDYNGVYKMVVVVGNDGERRRWWRIEQRQHIRNMYSFILPIMSLRLLLD